MSKVHILKRNTILTVALVIILFMLSGCDKATIKIGFIGSLTSKNSQLSIDARNAITLGIEQVNATGGVNGRLLEFVVKDDGADIEVALQKHTEFLNEGVNLVIGHTTSNMSEAVLKSQSENLLFLSPSMGASSLIGKDDYFITTSPLTDNQAKKFLELVKKLNIKNAVILYDLMNAEYTKNMAEYAKELSKLMKQVELRLLPFDSRTDDFKVVSEQILKNENTEMVLMISQAIDTAVLTQLLKKGNPNLVLCSVSWSMTEDLILNGGKAVDGMYFIGINKAQFPSESFTKFKSDFVNKYQYEPTFVSTLAFDAFSVLVEALKQSNNYSPKDIKSAILQQRTILGLEESFDLDEYGDSNREYLIYQLINDEFIPIYY